MDRFALGLAPFTVTADLLHGCFVGTARGLELDAAREEGKST